MLLGLLGRGSGGVLQVGFPGVDRPLGGCRSSLRRAGRHGVLRHVMRSGGVNQRGRLATGVGVMTCTTRVRARLGGSCAAVCQAADVPVAQPVEDQFDQLAGGGDLADAGAAAGGDLVTDPA